MFGRLRRDVREMFGELRDFRDLLLLMTQRTFILQYRRAAMGMAWAVFMPVLNTVVFTMIFTRVARIDTGGIPYPLFAYCGLLPWNLFAVSLKKSVNDLVTNKALLTKVYFPREIFPFSTILVSVIDFTVGLSLVAAMMFYYQIPPTATVLFVPVLIAVQLMFTAGLAMLLAPANLYFRDVKYILDVVVAVGMFATPVIYPTRHLNGTLGVLLQLNPLAPIIDGYRAVLLRGELPHPTAFAATAAFSLCLFAVGWLVFHRAEYAFAENV
jgi:ABC-type polysaccharide/polyol phosphate export permease